ncbi:MAG: factor-independent urate hydroxylase [Bryobacteraceae bacterium]
MHHFLSGSKRNYYGKDDVIVYRLNRDGQTPSGQCPVFGANVLMLIYGDAFWPTYETGDNTGLIATDSMKNFIQRETMNFPGYDLESYGRFLATRFLDTYPQVEGVQLTATEIPYRAIAGGGMALGPGGAAFAPGGGAAFTPGGGAAFAPGGGVAFAPGGPERSTARIELRRASGSLETVEVRSGIQGFRLLRLGGSAFYGFVRDQYTTLPDIRNRPLHMGLALDWLYTDTAAAFSDGAITAQVRAMVHQTFHAFESGSIQQIVYQLGTKMLAEIPQMAEVNLEAHNRTWDTIAERGETLGVYTDARPPVGCLGLTLRR